MTAVSVIVPAYNAAPYIAAALASACAQTLTAIEVLVVDDASTDGTAAIVAGVAAADRRVRVLRQAVNGGPSVARNRGLAEARGTWVALLDADDAYAPDRLATLVALAERVGADLCSDNLLLVPDGVAGAERAMIPAAVLDAPRALETAEFVQRNVADPDYPDLNLGFSKPLMRRAFLESHGLRYDERVRFAEDFGLYLDCLLAGGRWWLTPEPMYRYRVRPDSLTQVQTVHDLDILRRRLAGLQGRADATGDAPLAQLAARHRRVVDRSYYYRSFTDDIKRRSFATAAKTLFGSARSMTLIAEAVMTQLPVITKKLMAGGYRRT